MNRWERLTHWTLKGVFGFFSRLPLRLALALGTGLGYFAFCLLRRRRRIALDNARRALGPEISEAEVRRIVRGSFENLGRTLMEFCRVPRLTRSSLNRRVEVEGFDRVVRSLSAGRGVLLITAHFGNWELLPPAAALLGCPLAVVVRPMDWTPLDVLVSEMRSAHGTKLISKWQGMSEILGTLRRGGAVGILMDQNTIARVGVFVDFLGRPACTTIGVARAAIRTGAPVHAGCIVRRGRGRHRITVTEEIPVATTGDLRRDLETNTARFNQVLESFIQAHPDHWLWLHQRWKTQPPPSP